MRGSACQSAVCVNYKIINISVYSLSLNFKPPPKPPISFPAAVAPKMRIGNKPPIKATRKYAVQIKSCPNLTYFNVI